MTDTTNPRAEFDRALAAMRHTKRDDSTARVTLATVACAEALSLLVDAHLPTPEPDSEPESDPRESLPDDTHVGHGWVMGWGGSDLFKPESNGFFTRRNGHKWGPAGHWEKSELGVSRPATVGDLRHVELPESEWPVIPTPEPEAEQPEAEQPEAEAVAALRAVRDELAKLAVGYFAEGDDARSAYGECLCVVEGEARRRGLDLGEEAP